MTSPFGSESIKYCFSKVLLQAKLPDQKFFRNIRQRDFDSAAQAPFLSNWPAAESKSRWRMLRKNFWSGSLAYISTLEKQYFIDSEPKGEVITSKIDRLAAIYTSKFKWVWRAQFLSHTLQILEINLSFESVKMILIYLITFSFWYKKKWKRVLFLSIETFMIKPVWTEQY